jgi:hypothetical protein
MTLVGSRPHLSVFGSKDSKPLVPVSQFLLVHGAWSYRPMPSHRGREHDRERDRERERERERENREREVWITRGTTIPISPSSNN